MSDAALFDDRLARRNVAVLVAAQAIPGAQMVAVFTVGGLAGQQLSPIPCLATLPISLVVLGSMLAAQPMAGLMQRRGRQAGFFTGAGFGALGAVFGALGLIYASFALFLAGALSTGVYMSAHGFYRFAATDTASEGYRPKAISIVMAGGLAAALIGPQVVKATAGALFTPFLGTYLAIIGLNVLGAVIFCFLRIPKPPAPEAGAAIGRSKGELIRTPAVAVAIVCAMVSYALMNLVMTSTPLAVVGCGFGAGAAANVVSAHVFAMYAPAFFTGHLIARFGARRIVAVGLGLLAAAGAVALMGVELANFFVALVLLGVGWNFGFIGATTMLASLHRPEERGRVQGLNDAVVFGCVTLASLSSGGLMNCAGGDAVEGWTAVNLAMVPFLILAFGALIVLGRPRAGAPS